jgi:hypothetical protein
MPLVPAGSNAFRRKTESGCAFAFYGEVSYHGYFGVGHQLIHGGRGVKMKIYNDDRLVPYKNTTIDPLNTKAEIDGLLARWGIRQVFWDWNPEQNNVVLMFKLPERFGNAQPGVRLEPPRIWTKGNRKRREEINWHVSMRVLFWFLKSNLESAYLLQFDKTTAFLPWIASEDGKTVLRDVILPRLGKISEFEALPTEGQVRDQEKRQAAKIIDIPKEAP